MWNWLNRFENTISIPGRGIWTWLTATADVLETLAAIPKDMRDVVRYTTGEIKNIFKSTITRWKRYQRIWNTLLSPFVAIWTAIEWTVRTVATSGINFISNTYKTWKNTLNNAIRSTFWSIFSKKPVSDFKYEELKTSNVIKKNKNWFSKRRFGRKTFQSEQRDAKKINNSGYLDWVKDNDYKVNNQKEFPKINQISWKVKDGNNINNQKEILKSNQISSEVKGWKNDIKIPKKEEEIVNKKVEHRWVEEAKRILSDSACGKTIIDRLCKNHKDFWIIYDDTTAMWSCNADHTITIWTKMPNWIKELAPFNWKSRNNEFQKKHLLLHELSHVAIHSHKQEIPEIKEWLNIIQRYIDERKNIDWKTLSILSYRNDNTYETNWKKAREDFVEMLALRMNWNWNLCKKYLKLLSDEEHQSFRDNHWLATITKEDASKLQNIFDSIIRSYENMSN